MKKPQRTTTGPMHLHRTSGPRLRNVISAMPFEPARGLHWLVHVGSPLGISLLLHAAALFLFAGVTWAVGSGATRDGDLEFDVKVIAEGPAEAAAGGLHFVDESAVQRGLAAKPADGGLHAARLPSAADLGQLDVPAAPLPLVAPARGDVLGAARLEAADVTGVGGAGTLREWGAGGGPAERDVGGGGPVGGLWGVGAGQRARSVVYVVDRSASMSELTELVDHELKRSIGILKDDQLLGVICLRENQTFRFAPRLVPATLENKKQVFTWLAAQVPAFGSNLVPAVRVGLSYQPDVLFMVTDEIFLSEADEETKTSAAELRAVIRSARQRRKTTINAIVVRDGPMDDSPRHTAASQFLQSVTAETGGSVTFFQVDELLRRRPRTVPPP